MAEVTRETCRHIIDAFEHKDPLYPLTRWELAQLAYAWLEREDRRDVERAAGIQSPPAPSQAQSVIQQPVMWLDRGGVAWKNWQDAKEAGGEPEPLYRAAGIQSPAAPVGGEVKMRSEFHAWVKDRGCDTDGAWSAWQACWNLLVEAQPQPTEGEDAVHAPRIARWLTEVTNNRRNTERARGAALVLVDEWEGLEPSAPAMEGKTK